VRLFSIPKLDFYLIIYLAGLSSFLLFILYPMYSAVLAGFLSADGSAFTLSNWIRFLSYARYSQAVLNTLLIGLYVTIATFAIGVPLAYLLARFLMPGRTAIKALLTVPMIFPSFVIAWAWILLLGNNGMFTPYLKQFGVSIPVYGFWGIVLVESTLLYPYLILMSTPAFESIDVTLEDAAKTLGATGFDVFRTVTLPLAMPSCLSASLLVFITSIEWFGVPAIIGHGVPVLAVEAYYNFVSETEVNRPMAGVISMVLVLAAVAGLLGQRYYLSRKEFGMSLVSRARPKKLGRRSEILAASFPLMILSLTCVLPLVPVVAASFVKMKGPVFSDVLTIDNYVALFSEASRSIMNSLFLATVATLFASILGTLVGYAIVRKKSALGPVLDVAIMLPFALAGVVIGIGLATAFNRPPLFLTGTWMILVVAYYVRASPLILRASSSILRQIDPNIEHASVSLGVSPFRTFLRVTLPVMAPAVAAGAVLSWVYVLGELSSTIVLYYGPWTTMTLEVFKSVSYANFGYGSAAAVVLILLVLGPLIAINRLQASASEAGPAGG
jgi:iron(III) transport system permease protein